jgi:hypothetical protein
MFIEGTVRVVAVLIVGMLGFITAGCDDPPDGVPIVSGADFRPSLDLQPSPITFTAPSGVPCPLGGFAFNTSFHLVINAGVRDVRLDSVTIHMIDGTNVGGPSITIPQPELVARFGSTFINAATTRDFALHPDFGCITTPPLALRSNALLIDSRGVSQTISVQGRVR